MTPSSPSKLSRAAIVLALIASPHDGSSFPIVRAPLDARLGTGPSSPAMTTSRRRRGAPPLHATVDMPMRPIEDEKEKNSKKNNAGGGGSDEVQQQQQQQREWKQVVGGFVPKFLKRGAATTEVQMVDTIEEYKRVVVDEQDKLVVVRFFAPWCKSCKAAHPLFKKMMSEHAASGAVKFVEVPLTRDTAYIHEGLGVPSVPFGHIYHPQAGLVEEMKINKRVVKEFWSALDTYVAGSCDLPLEGEDEDVCDTVDEYQ